MAKLRTGSPEWETARKMCEELYRFLDKHGETADDFQGVYAELGALKHGPFAELDRDNGQFGVGA